MTRLLFSLNVMVLLAPGPVWANSLLDSVRPPRSSAARICAFCYAHSWEDRGLRGYGSRSGERSLKELAGLGVRAISLTPFALMRSLDDTTIQSIQDVAGGETDDRVRRAAAHAKRYGMAVMLKPHIWIHGGKWRGSIAPTPRAGGWSAWFAQYQRFIYHYAALAKRIGASWLVVGVELSSAVAADPGRWRRIIAGVRQRFPGKLVYAANWDRVDKVPFWSELDAIGVQMFAPLAPPGGGAPQFSQLVAAADRWLQRFRRVARHHNKQLILTEVGFVNRERTTESPHHWPERLGRQRRSPRGDREQSLAYRAIIETFGRSADVAQLYWWKWFSDPQTQEEGPVGFSPRAKPAASLLRRICAGP